MESFPGISSQSAGFYFFSATLEGTSFSNIVFEDMVERSKVDAIEIASNSSIVVRGLLNRVQHFTANEPVFGRIALKSPSITTRYSEVASVGHSEGFQYRQLNMTHTFLDVPPGVFTVEIQLRVAAGVCQLPDGIHGAGTRTLEIITVSK